MQEEFSSEDIPYILEVEELIVSCHEIKEASIAKKNDQIISRQVDQVANLAQL